MKNLFLLTLVTLLISSCASFYKPIDPHNMNYDSLEGRGLAYADKRNVLTLTGNIRYAKKEDKYDINIVSVKIQNNTNETISVKEDVIFFVDGREVYPLENYVVESKIKQRNIGLYALYSLLFLNISDGGGQRSYPIGVPIAVGNIGVAASSNAKFRNNFAADNLLNKIVKPGQTVYGLVAFRDLYSRKLELQLR
jgi:hypothetical protein